MKYYSVDCISGKNYYDENGRLAGYSVDSVFGGQNFYNEDGQHVGYSIDSVFENGQNLYSDEKGFVGYTLDSVTGNGQNLYTDNGLSGYSVDSLYGGFGEIDIDAF